MAGVHVEPSQMWSEDYQSDLIAMYLDVLGSLPFVVGTHPWCFADFRTAQSIMRVGSLNLKGVFTRDRQPKRAAHMLREQWTGAWLEQSCADIDVAALHAACLSAARRGGTVVETGSELRAARRDGDGWAVELSSREVRAGLIVDAAGAWGDEVAARCGIDQLGLIPKRRTVVQLRVGRTGGRSPR